MLLATWKMLKDTVLSFIEDEALTRGAAIAFYTVTSIAPVLLIVIAIAGLVFGRDAAQNAISDQFSGLMGRQTAEVLQSAIASAAGKSSSIIATIIGVATLIATASGVFGEMQAALNSIWKTKPQATTVPRLIRARAVSLGLVAALGFLLIVSLVISAGLTAFGNYLDAILPMGKLVLPVLNFVVSVVLLAILFGAIYKLAARPKSSMERCHYWRADHVSPLQYRKITHRLVHWQQRNSLELRRCRWPYRPTSLGLLFRPDIFVGIRVH